MITLDVWQCYFRLLLKTQNGTTSKKNAQRKVFTGLSVFFTRSRLDGSHTQGATTEHRASPLQLGKRRRVEANAKQEGWRGIPWGLQRCPEIHFHSRELSHDVPLQVIE